jgi:hypothetical protein
MSGPWSRPVSARRSGRNSARPLRPVSALSAAVSACQGSADQSIAAASAAARARKARSSSAARGGLDRSLDHRPPVRGLGDGGEVGADRLPCGGVHSGRGTRPATRSKSSWWTMRALSWASSPRRNARARGRSGRSRSSRSAARNRRRVRPDRWCRAGRAGRSAPGARCQPRGNGRRRASRGAWRACPRCRQQCLMREGGRRRRVLRTSGAGSRCWRHDPRRARHG